MSFHEAKKIGFVGVGYPTPPNAEVSMEKAPLLPQRLLVFFTLVYPMFFV